jgi:DNA-binding SARP family transcriptional activator/Tfp pilus assembly protein PilF
VAEDAEFGLLGPLQVRRGTAEVRIPPGKRRALLARLLLSANHVVSLEDLTETLWGAAPPGSARVTLQNYVKWLRRSLGDSGHNLIGTAPHGYVINVRPGQLDANRFEDQARAARKSARDGAWDRAAAQLRTALSLWRGEPLADVESELLAAREVPRLAELRLQALEARIDADLHLGGHGEVIAELRRLVSEHPLREPLHGLLMLALYRDGRQAEALAGYAGACEVLAEELGTQPGPDLRELHQRILSADPTLALIGRPAEPEPQRTVPRELPPTVPGFTGRQTELQALTRLLDQSSEQAPEAVVISAIGGTAGVGKTALAVHWSHRAAGRFPDGHLYVNLRGYDPGQPMPAADALAGFLRSLGVPGPDIPPEEGERAARYRSLLAGRRMLVVLDNARSASQVRPLLPGTPACTVLVTSRDTLAGLVARDGAARLHLDMLPLEDAIALLRTLIGARVDTEPGAAAELAAQCCRLPLALRVAADLASARPAASLASLTAEMADLRTRLGLLTAGGDPSTEVRAVFSWSYRHLDAGNARTFRLLGLHPGPDLDPYAAAAMAGATVQQARQALDTLTSAHLIQPAGPGRYSMHDLLRGYARELTSSIDTEEEQRAALTRLFDHYLHAAAAAMDVLLPAERHRRPRIPRPDTPIPPLPDPAAARQWLDAERPALVAVAGHTVAYDWPGHATRLSAILFRYLRSGGHIPEVITVSSHALGAARRTGDRVAEATALNQLGNIDRLQGRYRQAVDHHRQALSLFRAAGDRAGEAHALGNMGIAETELGRYEQAAHHLQAALASYRDIGDRVGEARTLGNLGAIRRMQGRYQEAAGYYGQALGLSRKIGDREGEATTLFRLGYFNLRLGRYQDAAGYLQRALALYQDMVDRDGEADILVRLGEVYLGLGRYDQAARNLEQALAMSREIGDPVLEANALNGLGDVLCRTGDADKAHAHHATALRLASEAGVPLHQARAHSGLARTYQADGDPVQARHHWQQALTHYDAIGAPEADEIRAQLATAGDDGDDKPTEEDGSTTNPSPDDLSSRCDSASSCEPTSPDRQ